MTNSISANYNSDVKVQIAFWFAGLVAFALFYVVFATPEQLGVDAADTLSVSWNILQGNGFTTSIIANEALFEQRSLPATQTIWPPGQPLAAATMSTLLGQDPTATLVMINALAHIATAVLVVAIGRSVGASRAISLACGFICLIAVPNWILVIRGHSEPLLAALSTLACYLLLRLRAEQGSSLITPAVIGAVLVCVAAFLTRYQAIALLIPLVLISLLARTGTISYSRFADKALIVTGATMLVVGAVLARNIWLVGSLTGSDSPMNWRTIESVSSALAILPPSLRQPAFVAQIVLVGSIALLAVWIAWRRKPADEDRRGHQVHIAMLFSTLSVAGTVGMFALLTFMTPAYPWIARYFISMLPLAVIAALTLSMTRYKPGLPGLPTWTQHPALATTISIVAIVLAVVCQIPAAEKLAEAKGIHIQQAVQNNNHLARLLNHQSSTIANQPILLSNQPSLLAVWTRHPVIGTPFPDPKKPQWGPTRIAQVVHDYQVTHVVQFDDYPAGWGRNDVDELLKAVPDWLTQTYRGDNVSIFRVNNKRLSSWLSNSTAPRSKSQRSPIRWVRQGSLVQ